ncbi:hypothetical protein SARC_05751 [Sphaeroforma arctica JP610]|uniref:Uncharacterized protein n=1 Tax=Sphaeroforma arctica JP610 TaxID=667725 RepID=A0A0L0FYQ0_9EUKA|nr:hypothetical protein SARC_05751 [Sphaeroforma arctica JP610]KNC81960.1 hypothetical protein SARC_05751 [Sphaeroforma arctica JP610]|eukprot:XP_014155862.1 hypothetical protein SARC_05751 [Sphaeroforma arctica JP610]
MPVSQASSRTFTPNNGEGAMYMDDEPTPARAPLDPAMSKFKVVIDTTIYDGNAYKVDIQALHKLRNAVHTQQPNRLIPEVDQRLSKLYNKAVKGCDKSDHDECIAINGLMSELTLIRSHVGDKISETKMNKLLKMSEFSKWPTHKYVSMADCRDTLEFVSVVKDLFANTNMPLVQYLSLVQELPRQTATTEVPRTALNNTRSSQQLWKDCTDGEVYNILIIDNLRHTPVNYLLEKWLNDFYNARRAARLRRTMLELEKRCKGTGR